MKKFGNILFVLAAVLIIILAAYRGATMHANCSECNRSVLPAQPVQFFVETGELGLGYMIASW